MINILSSIYVVYRYNLKRLLYLPVCLKNHHWHKGNLKNIPQMVSSMLMDEHDPSMLNLINHYRLSAIKTRLKHWSCHALRLRVLKFHKCHSKTITHTNTFTLHLQPLITGIHWFLFFNEFSAYVFSSPKKGPGPRTFQNRCFFMFFFRNQDARVESWSAKTPKMLPCKRPASWYNGVRGGCGTPFDATWESTHVVKIIAARWGTTKMSNNLLESG